MKADTVEEKIVLSENNQSVRDILSAEMVHCDCPEKSLHLLSCRRSRPPLSIDKERCRSSSGSRQSSRHRSNLPKSLQNQEINSDYEERKFRTRSPCRKTCSTIHHPMYHLGRFKIKMKGRGRPLSASNRDAMNLRTDWIKTNLYMEITKTKRY